MAAISALGQAEQHEVVRGDPSAEAIVRHLQQIDSTAPIEILGKRRMHNSVSGQAYTIVKLRFGSRDLNCAINEASGEIALDAQLPAREARSILEALPPVYRKMGPSLLGSVRESQGGVLGAEIEEDRQLEVTFYTDSPEGLLVVRTLVGPRPATAFDSQEAFSRSRPQVRRSKEGELEPPVVLDAYWVTTRLPVSETLLIGADDAVTRIVLAGRKALNLDRSIPRINADTVQGFGLLGSSAAIGIVDSGVDDTHPDLDLPITGLDLVIAEMDFTGAGGADPSDDTLGHGTAVAGCAISNHPMFTGVSPFASVISAKIDSGGPLSSLDATINMGVAWATAQGADIINLSLGGPPTGGAMNAQDPVSVQADHEAFQNNRTVSVAIGNTGTNVVHAPADAFNVITVGATELQAGAAPSVVAGFSTFGPMEGRSKPDVVAPGDNVGADDIDTTAFDWEPAAGDANDITDYRGTSFSAPHVSGMAALLWDFGSSNDILTDTPTIKAAIVNSANRLAGWSSPSALQPLDPMQGAGEIDALAAFRAYADDLRIWQQRVTGTDEEHSHWYHLNIDGAPATIVATLVYERHVTTAAAAAPDLNDLDLHLYDPAGNLLESSISLVDSVEHIVHDVNANGRYCLEVDPFDLSEGNAELYALAANRRLSFVGNTNPCVPDFGDAPDPYTGPGQYPTLLASNGANHLDWTKEWLGSSRPEIDGELEKASLDVRTRVDPFPSVSGESDADDPDDQDTVPNLVNRDVFDDGTDIGPFIFAGPKTISVTIQTTVDDTGVGATGRYDSTAAGKRLYLNGWADWNGDGDWDDPAEKIIGMGSPTGQVAIDPEAFGPNGRFTIGETFTDSNGSGEWEPGEPFEDTVGATETTLQFGVVPPTAIILASYYVRLRLDYGEDVGTVANVSGNLDQEKGTAQFGEVEDYLVPVEVLWDFAGIAQGGQVVFTIAGVTLTVTTQVGDTAAVVATKVAVAINEDSTLAALGIGAVASGNRVGTNGEITSTEIQDAGLLHVARIPLLSSWGLALLLLSLLAAGVLLLRKQNLPQASDL